MQMTPSFSLNLKWKPKKNSIENFNLIYAKLKTGNKAERQPTKWRGGEGAMKWEAGDLVFGWF